MLLSPHVKSLDLNAVKPFALTAPPIRGESLLGFVSRSLAETPVRRMVTGLALAGIGTLRPESMPISLQEPSQVHGLATLLGTSDDEISRRLFHGEGTDALTRLVNFYGLPIRERYREYRFRRLSPGALRSSEYYRAVWDLRFLSFDPDTLEVLFDSCPECSGKLDWQRCLGISKCNRCLDHRGVPQVDIRDYPTSVVEVSDVEGLRLIPSLLSPVPEVRERMLPTLSADWSGYKLQYLVEMALSVAIAVSDLKQRRGSYAPPAVDGFASVQPNHLAQGGRILLSGKKALAELVRSMRQDLIKDSQEVPLSELFGDLPSLQRNYLLPESILQVFSEALRLDLDELPFRRSFADRLERDDGRVRISVAAERTGLSEAQLGKLVRGKLVPHITAGYRGTTVLIHPDDLQLFVEQLVGTMVDDELAKLLRVSPGCVPLLEQLGLVELAQDISASLAPERYYLAASGKALLEAVAATVPKGHREGAPTIASLLARTQRHCGRWGAALNLLREDPANFRRGASMLDWRHISVVNPDRFVAQLDEVPTDFEWLDSAQAAEVIGTGWSIVAALGRNGLLARINPPSAKFTRSSVQAFADKYILGGEILERTTAFPPYGVRRGMTKMGVSPAVQLKEKPTLIYDRQEALRVLAQLEATLSA